MSIPGVPDEFEELMPCSARRDAEKLRGALHTLMDFAERLRTMSDEELEAWRQAAADAARGER